MEAKKEMKDMNLLEAMEYIVALAKGSELSDEFYNKADEYVCFIADKLQLSKEQSVMLSLFIDKSDNRSILASDYCGDFTDRGTEAEALDFLNWFIALSHPHKLFVTGNHDLCLWDAEDIDNLPPNVLFLQDKACEIGGVKFFGLGYNHSERLIPNAVDVLITHEPPMMIRDKSNGTHWGNLPLRNRVMEVKPKFHLFGHAHESYGTDVFSNTVFSNGAVLDDQYHLVNAPAQLTLET